MKVAIDTNVLVSAFATRGLCADLLHAVIAEHQLIVGQTALGELRRVLRDKIRVPATAINDVEDFLRSQALIATCTTLPALRMRDAADLPILGEALAAGADVLLTGDRDLLDVADMVEGLDVLSPREFWERLRTTPSGHSRQP